MRELDNILWLAAAVALVVSACAPHNPPSARTAAAAFEAERVDLGGRSPALMLHFTNGVSVAVEDDKLTLYFPPSDTLTAWFDPETRRLLKTLLEVPATDTGPAQWVRDLNADGVPDLRKFKGGGTEVFFDGRWYPSRPGGGTNTLILFRGRETRLYLDRGVWKEAPDRQ